MPANFVPQTDDGLATGANAYVDVATFRQYFLDRGKDVSAFTDTQVQTAIVLATDYIDNRWRLLFAGSPLLITQETEWPRQNVVGDAGEDIVGVPTKLKRACSEYALRAAQLGSLVDDAPRPIGTDGQPQPRGQVLEDETVVGPITTRRRYGEEADGPLSGTITTEGCLLPKIPAADLLIEYLLDSASNQRSTFRA